ncbi:MAG: NUDIX domain-containing protein [Ruminococcaceae bacterium]|nr:NUDIX domain-containing protein [Oscillospiraceae bacterium]
MLAKRVRVNVYGEISDGLYSGYSSAEGVNNVSSYILSRKNVFDFLRGVVIAVATLKNGEQKCVVAPEGEIYYEPEIKEKLSNLRNVEIESLSCLYEKSCGAIIIHKANENNYKVLLVKNHNGRYWSFPKGHVEKGETEEQTAIREIKEETGLDVEIVDSFREVSDYTPFGRIKKRVVFFMAQTFSTDVKVQKEEIDSFIWVDLFDVHNKCTYDNDLRVIKKARENISKLK